MRRIRPAKARIAAAARDVAVHALVLLTLVAFALQGIVTQTHFHFATAGGTDEAVTFGAKAPAAPHNTPVKDDESKCPICQVFAATGHFVTPTAAAALAPNFTVSVIPLAVETGHLVPLVTHIWLGRGPPLTRSN